jgi:hypothetical protein
MKLDAISRNLKREFRNTLNVSISYFRGAEYRMQSNADGFWPD